MKLTSIISLLAVGAAAMPNNAYEQQAIIDRAALAKQKSEVVSQVRAANAQASSALAYQAAVVSSLNAEAGIVQPTVLPHAAQPVKVVIVTKIVTVTRSDGKPTISTQVTPTVLSSGSKPPPAPAPAPTSAPTSAAPAPAPAPSSSPKPTTSAAPAPKPSTSKSQKPKPTNGGGSGGGGSSNKDTFTGDGTYYTPGLGSCGETNTEADLIAAINAPQYGTNANPNQAAVCGKCALVHGPKGEVKVKITDRCPVCKHGDLDLSPAAFDKIGVQAEGRIKISWSFVAC